MPLPVYAFDSGSDQYQTMTVSLDCEMEINRSGAIRLANSAASSANVSHLDNEPRKTLNCTVIVGSP
jgi:hypothetical protein